MKLKLLTALFAFSVTSTSFGLELSGEVGFYHTKLKGGYTRQVGYSLWSSKKEGFLFKLNFEEEFKLGQDARFKFSGITGTTKAPFVTVSTPTRERLFPETVRSFNLKELYLEKEHFLLQKLSLKAGKQRFDLFPLINDYLWGGALTFRFSKNLSFTWYQIAGYEGKHLLFNSEQEDDIDVFGGRVDWKTFLGKLTLGVYRISDARGEKVGVNKDAFVFVLEPKISESLSTVLAGASQSGKNLLVASLKAYAFELSGGYAKKGFTSYGFREGFRDLGYIYKPTLSNVTFLKVGTRFSFKGLNFKLHSLYLQDLGSEVGGEVSYPFYRGELFLDGALGTNGSYFSYAGYRWGVRTLPLLHYFGEIELKNYFNILGEYADLPKKRYFPQLGYEGWERARHVGFWHSTYKLSVNVKSFSFKVSTGKDSKVDYVIWGNTADNYLYEKDHGKLWHLEEFSYSLKSFKLGLQRIKLPGFISEDLTGTTYSERVNWGVFQREGETGTFLTFPLNVAEVYYFRFKSTNLYAISGKYRYFFAGYLKESGDKDGWGAYIGGNYDLRLLKGTFLYRVYSPEFTTFGLREFFRDDGFIYRPGERDVRFLKLKVSRELPVLKKFRTRVSLVYDRLSRFSGSYVGEEGGVVISLKPGKRCSLEIVEFLGSQNTYYHGLRFSLTW